jgi:2-octaprenyl-6-methoxyphenol hydroxylase
LKIGAQIKRYGQKALTFAVTHPIPHNNVSTEVHRTGGPFTLVPLPDHQGRPCSAVVWMDDGAASQTRLTRSKDAFEAEITERSCHLFGPLTLASRRTIWPITSLLADRFYGERTALIAEAAHAVPPIGAQGLNMSLSDIATLLDLAEQDPANIGTPAMLKRYEATRRRDIQLRVTGIDLLNRASQLEMPLLRDARAATLSLLHNIAPVRRGLMHLGLGAERT